MALYFSGVNTGRDYEVGQTYRMGGDTYVAQADGSFTNQQTGRSFAGSSNPSYGQSVDWTYTGNSYSSGTPFDAPTQAYVDSARASAQQIVSSAIYGAAASSGEPGRLTTKAVPVAAGSSSGANVARLLSGRSSGFTYAGGDSRGLSFNGITQAIMKTPEWIADFKDEAKHVISRFQVLDTYDGLPKNPIPGVQYYSRTAIPGFNFFWDMSQTPVEDGWEPFAGEPGEWIGGINNMVAASINSVPRNYESWLNSIYQGLYATKDEPSFLYVPGFPAATIAMPNDWREQVKDNPVSQVIQSFQKAGSEFLADIVRGRPSYEGPLWGSAAQEPFVFR